MGVFTGRVVIVDTNGLPVQKVTVELLEVTAFSPGDRPSQHVVATATTDEAGEAVFTPLDDTKRYFARPRGKGLSVQLLLPSSTAGGVTDHGALTGLANDDHTQYATNTEFDDHNARHEPGGADAMAVDAAAATGSLRTLGTAATAACPGNDARLSDSRTPTAHEIDGALHTATAGLSVAKGGTGRKALTDQSLLLGRGTAAISWLTLTTDQLLVGVTGGDPTALDVAASRIVGKKSTGGVVALTGAEVLAILSGQAAAAFAMNSQKVTGLAAATATGDAMRFDETPKLSGDLEGTVATPTVKAASLTVAGKVEIATAAETTSGTDAGRAVSPDGLAGSDYGKRVMYIKEVVAAATALTTGDAKTTVVIPVELNGWNLVQAEARVYTVGTGATLINIQVRNVTDAVNMLSTAITIDASELTSYSAAARSAVDGAHDDVATADIIAIDIDAINNTVVALGLDVILTWQLP